MILFRIIIIVISTNAIANASDLGILIGSLNALNIAIGSDAIGCCNGRICVSNSKTPIRASRSGGYIPNSGKNWLYPAVNNTVADCSTALPIPRINPVNIPGIAVGNVIFF